MPKIFLTGTAILTQLTEMEPQRCDKQRQWSANVFAELPRRSALKTGGPNMPRKTKLQVVQPKPPAPTDRATVLRGQIEKLEAALVKAEAHYWNAIGSLARDGVAVVVEVGDSHGKMHKKLRVNAAVRIQREAERTVDELREKLTGLRNELATVVGGQDGWDAFTATGGSNGN
jgi:hypothetical protein